MNRPGCLDCGAACLGIALRCPPCAQKHSAERQKAYRERHRFLKFPNRGVACDKCGASLTNPRGMLCNDCMTTKRRDPRRGTVCLTCGVSIADRPRALRCEPHAKLAGREAWQRANARRAARRAARRQDDY